MAQALNVYAYVVKRELNTLGLVPVKSAAGRPSLGQKRSSSVQQETLKLWKSLDPKVPGEFQRVAKALGITCRSLGHRLFQLRR
jgi:hypothetical protein